MMGLRCILRLNLNLGNRTSDFGMLLMPLALCRRLQRLIKWWITWLQIFHHARGLLVEALLGALVIAQIVAIDTEESCVVFRHEFVSLHLLALAPHIILWGEELDFLAEIP